MFRTVKTFLIIFENFYKVVSIIFSINLSFLIFFVAPWLCLIISSVFLILFTVMACWKCHGIGIFKEKSKKVTNLQAANIEVA